MPLVEDPTDNCSVNVFPIGEQLFTMTETPYWLDISQDTLKTNARVGQLISYWFLITQEEALTQIISVWYTLDAMPYSFCFNAAIPL